MLVVARRRPSGEEETHQAGEWLIGESYRRSRRYSGSFSRRSSPASAQAFMAMLKHPVHLNNAHSRAPLRPTETRDRRLRTAARSMKPGSARAVWRTAAPDAIAD
jgi:hypothetical protein